MSTLAIVPARGGSKGIKHKNIVDVHGKPLIAYTIGPALRLKAEGSLVDVVVSTDSHQISEVAQDLGASVPCLRPDAISGDEARTPEAVIHMLEHCLALGMTIDSVLVLQPTSPLRRYDDLTGALELYERAEADSLISCYLDETMGDNILYRREGDHAAPLSRSHNRGVRRQDHEKLYIRNGAIYLTRASYLTAHRRVISDRPLLYAMPKSRSVNVDTEEDLALLRQLLEPGTGQL